jgi:hypothetical protein
VLVQLSVIAECALEGSFFVFNSPRNGRIFLTRLYHPSKCTFTTVCQLCRYAGHYVPAVASRVFHAMHDGEAPTIRLAGLAIGNGLTDPAIQYGAYADFAAEHGLISNDTRDRILLTYPACKLALQACDGFGVAVECMLVSLFNLLFISYVYITLLFIS